MASIARPISVMSLPKVVLMLRIDDKLTENGIRMHYYVIY